MVEQAQTLIESAKKRRLRSPAYPALNLQTALQKAEALRKIHGRNTMHVDTILQTIGSKPKSGTGMARLSALIKYGLLEDEGSSETRRARLTQAAMDILLDDDPDSKQREKAVKIAALNPSIHKEMWDKYQGAIPGDTTLRVYLRRDRGFGDEAAKELTNEFRATLAYAKLTQSDIISPTAEDKSTLDGEVKMTPPETIESAPKQTLPAVATAPKTGEVAKGNPPQTNRTVQIPLTGASWALLQIPYPMSEENWEEMERFLQLMKKPLTTPNR